MLSIEDRSTAIELLEHPFITREGISGIMIKERKVMINFEYEMDITELM